MKTKLFAAFIISVAVVMASSCSSQLAIPTPTMQVSQSPIQTQTPTAQLHTPVPLESSAESSIFDFSDIPAYSGKAYIQLNNNVPYFTESDMTTEAFEYYSPIDSLGRCGVAYANVCKEIMPTEKRGTIGQIKPSGWHTIKYDFIDGGYLYNRCHLIAYQLAGENSEERNLITGTRFLNTQGMLPFENRVADYVNNTGNHVLFRVTPIYMEDDLLAFGVLLEAVSVEDKGIGLSFNVFCYNIQPGVAIDYATGYSWADGSMSEQTPSTKATASAAQNTEDTNSITYILNKNTKKFHLPSCKGLKDIKNKNKIEFTGTRDEVLEQGYTPCKLCNS